MASQQAHLKRVRLCIMEAGVYLEDPDEELSDRDLSMALVRLREGAQHLVQAQMARQLEGNDG